MENYQEIVNRIGKRLYKETVRWSREHIPNCKKYRFEAVQAIKGRKKFHTKKEEEWVAEQMGVWAWEMRDNRASHHKVGGRGEPKPIQDRVRERRENLIKQASHGQRQDYSGQTQIRVEYGQPSAWTETSKGDQYSRSCTYRKTDAVHVIRVPKDWYHKVHKRGLDRIHGMMTLDAEPVTVEEYTAYRATWLRSMGKKLAPEKGYIVLDPDHGAVHAKTLTAAKVTLTKRRNEARFAKFETRIMKRLREMRLDGYGQIQVTIHDSLQAGNCEPGTLEFRDRHFPGQDSAPIEEVLTMNSMREWAINACLRAIRRVGVEEAEAA